jgi:hypothetical protein
VGEKEMDTNSLNTRRRRKIAKATKQCIKLPIVSSSSSLSHRDTHRPQKIFFSFTLFIFHIFLYIPSVFLVFIFWEKILIGKLQSRSYKIAYALLNKLSKHGGDGVVGNGTDELMGSSSFKPGDWVALVYHKSDAIGFI